MQHNCISNFSVMLITIIIASKGPMCRILGVISRHMILVIMFSLAYNHPENSNCASL